MVVQHRHLPTSYAGADVRHTVVIPYRLMLVVGIGLPCLCRQPHHLLLRLLVRTYQRTTATCGNHLVAVERQDAEVAERAQRLSFVL